MKTIKSWKSLTEKMKFAEVSMGFLTILTAGATYLFKVISLMILCSLLIFALFFLVRYVSKIILNAKTESFGIIRNTYNTKQVSIAKNSHKYSPLLLLPASLLFILGIVPTSGETCPYLSDTPMIAVCKFSNEKNDDFSYTLITDINQKIDALPNIQVSLIDTFYNATISSKKAELEKNLNSVCAKQGIVVFGKRSNESQLFDCSIYLSNNLKSELEKTIVEFGDVLRLKQLDQIEFSIVQQSEIVSDFILGLFHFYQGDFATSDKIFTNIESMVDDQFDERFVIAAKIFLANSKYYLGNEAECKRIFEGLKSSRYCQDIIQENIKLLNDSTARVEHKSQNPSNAESKSNDQASTLNQNKIANDLTKEKFANDSPSKTQQDSSETMVNEQFKEDEYLKRVAKLKACIKPCPEMPSLHHLFMDNEKITGCMTTLKLVEHEGPSLALNSNWTYLFFIGSYGDKTWGAFDEDGKILVAFEHKTRGKAEVIAKDVLLRRKL